MASGRPLEGSFGAFSCLEGGAIDICEFGIPEVNTLQLTLAVFRQAHSKQAVEFWNQNVAAHFGGFEAPRLKAVPLIVTSC